MNINNLSKQILYKEIENEANEWSGKFYSGLNAIKSVLNDDIIDFSNTSFHNSILYNFCDIKLEEFLIKTNNNFALFDKYFMFLEDHVSDFNLEKIHFSFYKILILYFIKSKACNTAYSTNCGKFIVYLISEIDKLYDKNLKAYKKSMNDLLTAYLLVFSLSSHNSSSDDVYNFELKIAECFINLIYNLSITNDKTFPKKFFVNFIDVLNCPFYKDLNEKNIIKNQYLTKPFIVPKVKSNRSELTDKYYFELSFRYAMAMKNKKYQNEQLQKFRDNHDILNSILWSNKYINDYIKSHVEKYFNKNLWTYQY